MSVTHPFQLEWLIGTSVWLYPIFVLLVNVAVISSIALIFSHVGLPQSLWVRVTLLGGAILLFRSPYLAADLRLSPDSVEYAIGAARLVSDGIYALPLNHFDAPPRYAPWFSGLIIAPAYFVPGLGIGAGVLLIWLYALILLTAIARVGELLGGKHVAVLAAVLLLATPHLRSLSREILTDIPSLAMVVLLGLFFIVSRQRGTSSLSQSVAVSLVLMWAVAMRPLSVVAILPFVFQALKHRTAKHLFLQLLPTAILGILTLVYQQAVFGDFWRTGYQYWSSVPYDFSQLVFSWHYLSGNLETFLLQTGAPLLVGAALLSGKVKPRESADQENIKGWSFYAAIVAVPQLLFFLLYFYSSPRLMLPIAALCVPLAALSLSVLRERANVSAGALSISLTLITLLCGIGLAFSDRGIKREELLRAFAQYAPPDSVIISAINPAQVSFAVGSDNEVLPISRAVEYASKFIAARSVSQVEPVPAHWNDHRAKQLLGVGAKDAFERTAVNSIEYLQALLQQGRPILLETRFSSTSDVALLQRHFAFTPVASDIVQLSERSGFRSVIEPDYSSSVHK